MANYELADAAEADLRKIAVYTVSKWGGRQAVRYGALMEAHFDAIGSGKGKNTGLSPTPARATGIAGRASLCIPSRAGKAASADPRCIS